jgi:membrane-associated protease RseP (regulator of RpoE activity)
MTSVTTEAARDVDRRGLARLGIIVALMTALSFVLHIGGAVIVVTAILTMIMLHEFGHFITAKWAGMKVTDFFVGFGPILWAIQRGEVRYGVRALPLGGYVRVIGMNNLEEVDPADEPRTYRAKSYWQRVRFAIAGSTMHFIIAFVLMIVFLAGFGVVKTTTTIDEVAKQSPAGMGLSPAYSAGLQAGDRVVAVDGRAIDTWEQARDVIHNSPGKAVAVTVLRGGERVTANITPQSITDENGKEVGIIGITAGEKAVRDLSPAVFWHATVELKNITVESTKGLINLAKPDNVKHYGTQLTQTGPADPQKDGNRLLSPVGLARLANASAKSGAASVLTLLIAINIFVALFNMLPLPPFDGGHVAVATYEEIASRIKGRRHMMDMNKMLPVAYAVVVGLALLSLSALWLDIVHPFKLG